MQPREFLTSQEEVDLKVDGENICGQIYRSEYRDPMEGAPLGDFLADFVELQNDPTAAYRGFHVLACLGSVHGRFRQKFLQTVSGAELVMMVVKHVDDSLVQRKAMYFISVLAMEEDNRILLIEANIVQALGEVVTKLYDSDDVLQRACVAFSNLSIVPFEKKVAIGQEGGIRIIKGVISRPEINVTTLMACLVTLRNVTVACHENMLICRDENMPEIVFNIMIDHKHNLGVQGQAVVVMTYLAKQDDELREKLGNSPEKLEAFVNLIKSSGRSQSVAEHTLELLKVLLDKNESATEIVCKNNLIEIIQERFDAFSSSAKFVENACAVLRALGFLPEPRDMMREQGTFERLITSLRHYDSNVNVVEQSLCAISNACVDNPKNQESLGMRGAVEATIHVMEMHRENPLLQDYGCRALRNLADNCEFNVRIEGENGGINAATFAILGFPRNAVLTEQACAALSNMAQSEQNAIRMLQQDVQDIVTQALGSIDSEDAQKQATRVLLALKTHVDRAEMSSRGRDSATAKNMGHIPSGMYRFRSGQAVVSRRTVNRRLGRMRLKSMQRQEVKADDTVNQRGAGQSLT